MPDPPARLCFFIQNHRPPAQAARLISALRRGAGDPFVLVGHDPFAGAGTAEEAERTLGVPVFGFPHPARRGYFSLIRPWFEAVEWLAGRGIPYDWLVYLSAQDYPTRPVAQLAALLGSTRADGFLRHWPAYGPGGPWRKRQGRRRYALQYFDAPPALAPLLWALRWINGLQPFVHLHRVYGPRVGVWRGEGPFTGGRVPYGGTQWSVLRRACAEFAAGRARSGDPVVRWFERTVCPDEAVVQTLLVHDGRFRLDDDDLHFTAMAGSRTGRPRVLGMKDLPSLLTGRHFFARKFDAETDSRVLDALDRHLAAGGEV
jgi:hypothetical protein